MLHDTLLWAVVCSIVHELVASGVQHDGHDSAITATGRPQQLSVVAGVFVQQSLFLLDCKGSRQKADKNGMHVLAVLS